MSGSAVSPKEWCRLVRDTRLQPERTFVVMHLFAGERRAKNVQAYLEVKMRNAGLKLLMLSVDIKDDAEWDLSAKDLFEELMQLAEGGYLDAVLGGPPCGTFSRLRWLPNFPGLRPLRIRGDWNWGLPNLMPHEKNRVLEANTLVFFMMSLCEAVANKDGVFLIEHPQDPGHYPWRRWR